MMLAYAHHLAEQSAPRLSAIVVVEALVPARLAEGLTWKTGQADVERGDIVLVYLRDIAVGERRTGARVHEQVAGGGAGLFGRWEIQGAGLCRVRIELAGEDGLKLVEGTLEPEACAADAREQVYRLVHAAPFRRIRTQNTIRTRFQGKRLAGNIKRPAGNGCPRVFFLSLPRIRRARQATAVAHAARLALARA